MLYNSKKYDEAASNYSSALEKSPDDAVANFNMGNAQYRKGVFGKAVESYNKALVKEESIRARADYNIGNSKYRIGRPKEQSDPAEAIEVYTSALEYYRRAIELDPKDMDAKFNYEFIERKIKSLAQNTPKKQEDKKEQKGGGGGEGKEEKPQGGSGQQEKQKSESEKDQKPEKQEGSEEQKGAEKPEKQKEKQKGAEGQKEKQESSEGQEEKQEEAQEEKQGEEGLEFYQKPEGSEEMTPTEAKMLLESYGQEDESRKQVRMRRKSADYPEPEKDW